MSPGILPQENSVRSTLRRCGWIVAGSLAVVAVNSCRRTAYDHAEFLSPSGQYLMEIRRSTAGGLLEASRRTLTLVSARNGDRTVFSGVELYSEELLDTAFPVRWPRAVWAAEKVLSFKRARRSTQACDQLDIHNGAARDLDYLLILAADWVLVIDLKRGERASIATTLPRAGDRRYMYIEGRWSDARELSRAEAYGDGTGTAASSRLGVEITDAGPRLTIEPLRAGAPDCAKGR